MSYKTVPNAVTYVNSSYDIFLNPEKFDFESQAY